MDAPARRPRLFTEPTTALSASVPISIVDRICTMAARYHLSVSQVTSRILIMALRQSSPGPAKCPPE